MASIIQDIAGEVSDNWPAFLYILVATGFSIRFLSERRAETRVLRQMGEELHQTICIRLDRIEHLVQYSITEKIIEERPAPTTDQPGLEARHAALSPSLHLDRERISRGDWSQAKPPKLGHSG